MVASVVVIFAPAFADEVCCVEICPDEAWEPAKLNLPRTASAGSATPAANSARRSIISAISLVRAPNLLQPLIAAAVPTIKLVLDSVRHVEILVIILSRVKRSGV